MYHLTQASDGNWVMATDTVGNQIGTLVNVHSPQACAQAAGCGIHNRPSNHPLKNAPLFWRERDYILERICEHAIAHPDKDSAAYLRSIGQNVKNIHTCDGCC